MLGDLLLGDQMLGGDPGDTSGGSGGTGLGNLLGGLFLGDTMLGGDPGSGSGGGGTTVALTGSAQPLAAKVTSNATVGGSLSLLSSMRATVPTTTAVSANLTASSLRGSLSVGTSVQATLHLDVERLTSQAITGKTSFSKATLGTKLTLAGSISAKTTVTCLTLTSSNLGGNRITGRTTVSVNTLLEKVALRAQTPGGRTTISVYLSTTIRLAGQAITGVTTLHGNAVKPFFLSGGTCAGTSSVIANMTRNILNAQKIKGFATLVVSMQYAGKFYANIAGKTTMTCRDGGFGRLLAAWDATVFNPIAGSTAVKARLYSYPTDFYPIYINLSTRVEARTLAIQIAGSGHAYGYTAVRGDTYGLWHLAGKIAGKTTIAGRAKAGFGQDISCRTIIFVNLGVKYVSGTGGLIRGKTTVTGITPKNGFSGHAWGGTRWTIGGYGRPDSDIGYYIGSDWNYSGYYGGNYYAPGQLHLPNLSLIVTGLNAKVNLRTRLHTHYDHAVVTPNIIYTDWTGRWPSYDGPYGYVSLDVVPKGDLGRTSNIGCLGGISGALTVDRHRMLVFGGDAGVRTGRSLSVTGSAVAGTEIRTVSEQVGIRTGAQSVPGDQISTLTTYYS